MVGGLLDEGLPESPTLGGVVAGLVSELPIAAPDSGFLIGLCPFALSDSSVDCVLPIMLYLLALLRSVIKLCKLGLNS